MNIHINRINIDGLFFYVCHLRKPHPICTIIFQMRVHKLKLGALNHGPKRTTRKNLDGGLGDEDP